MIGAMRTKAQLIELITEQGSAQFAKAVGVTRRTADRYRYDKHLPGYRVAMRIEAAYPIKARKAKPADQREPA